MCANAGMYLEIGNQWYDSQPGLYKRNTEFNCSCIHIYIHASIVPPAIGLFMEEAGETPQLDPLVVLGYTVNSCEKQSLSALPCVDIIPNHTIAEANDPNFRLHSFRSVCRGEPYPEVCVKVLPVTR